MFHKPKSAGYRAPFPRGPFGIPFRRGGGVSLRGRSRAIRPGNVPAFSVSTPWLWFGAEDAYRIQEDASGDITAIQSAVNPEHVFLPHGSGSSKATMTTTGTHDAIAIDTMDDLYQGDFWVNRGTAPEFTVMNIFDNFSYSAWGIFWRAMSISSGINCYLVTESTSYVRYEDTASGGAQINGNIADGKMHCIITALSGTSLAIYLDGAVVTATIPGGTFSDDAGLEPFGWDDRVFVRDVLEFAVWDRAINSYEAAFLWNKYSDKYSDLL